MAARPAQRRWRHITSEEHPHELAASADSVNLFYTGTDRHVYWQNAVEPGQGPVNLGARLVGGPAAAVVPAGVLGPSSALAVFGRGTDNALWWRHQTASGWTSWQSLGGVLTSKPAAAAGMTDQFGPLGVFARGSDGVVWFRTYGPGGNWSRWTSFAALSPGAAFGVHLLSGTAPAAANGNGIFLLAVTGVDHHVWVFGRTGMQYGFPDFGGRTIANPGITSVSSTTPVVYARGTDNALWYRPSMMPIGATAPWHSLGGRLTSGVAATTVPGGETYAFVLGTDNQL